MGRAGPLRRLWTLAQRACYSPPRELSARGRPGLTCGGRRASAQARVLRLCQEIIGHVERDMPSSSRGDHHPHGEPPSPGRRGSDGTHLDARLQPVRQTSSGRSAVCGGNGSRLRRRSAVMPADDRQQRLAAELRRIPVVLRRSCGGLSAELPRTLANRCRRLPVFLGSFARVRWWSVKQKVSGRPVQTPAKWALSAPGKRFANVRPSGYRPLQVPSSQATMQAGTAQTLPSVSSRLRVASIPRP